MVLQPLPDLWTFSTGLYAHDPVKAAALSLQDAGLDVNVAFWIVWSVVCGRDPVPGLPLAMERASGWHALAVGPLRGVRDRLKHVSDPIPPEPAAALRHDVLKVELAAEAIAQTMLAAIELPARADGPDMQAAGEALEHYAASTGVAAPVGQFKEAVFSAMKKE